MAWARACGLLGFVRVGCRDEVKKRMVERVGRRWMLGFVGVVKVRYGS